MQVLLGIGSSNVLITIRISRSHRIADERDFQVSRHFLLAYSKKSILRTLLLGAVGRPGPLRVLLSLSDDTSNGPVLLARRRLVAGRRPGRPGWSWRPMMMQRRRRPPRRRRRMRSVGRVVSLLAAGRRRGRPVLLLLQQLPKLLDRFVQRPQLRQQ